MRFVYRLEPDDFPALTEAVGLRRRFGQPHPVLWYALGLGNIGLLALSLMLIEPPRIGQLLVHGAIAVFAFSAPYLYRRHFRTVTRRHPSAGLPITAEFTDTEIVSRYGDEEERIRLDGIERIEERSEHVLFWLAPRQAAILPKRAEGGDWRQAIAWVEERRMTDEREADGTATLDGGAGAATRVPWSRDVSPDAAFEKTVVPSFKDQVAVDFPGRPPVSRTSVVGLSTLVAMGIGAYRAFPSFEAGDTAGAAVAIATWTAGGLAAGLALHLVLRFLIGRFFAFGLRQEGAIDQPVHLRFDPDGIENVRAGRVSRLSWDEIVEAGDDGERYVFRSSPTNAAWIRKDAFSDDSERRAFEDRVEAWYGRPLRSPAHGTGERMPQPSAQEPPKVSQ